MSKFRNLFLLTIIFTPLLNPVPAVADVVVLTIGGGSWQASPEGDIGRTDINLESTLNLDEGNNPFAYVALKHPLPLLPNIRLQHS